jgi:hypothetical protein
MSIAVTLKSNMDNLVRFLEFSQSYIVRHNPILAIIADIANTLKDLLSSSKKLKIAKYRVNHLSYRLHQMEQLIHDNNPNNYKAGKSIDLMK